MLIAVDCYIILEHVKTYNFILEVMLQYDEVIVQKREKRKAQHGNEIQNIICRRILINNYAYLF